MSAVFEKIDGDGKWFEYLRHTSDGRVFCLWPDGRFVEVIEKPTQDKPPESGK